jgi:hypothetical protein
MGGKADVEQIHVAAAPERARQQEVDRVVVADGDPGDPNSPGQEPVECKQARGDRVRASR